MGWRAPQLATHSSACPSHLLTPTPLDHSCPRLFPPLNFNHPPQFFFSSSPSYFILLLGYLIYYFFSACFCPIPAALQPHHRCSPFSPLLFIIAQVSSFCLSCFIFCLFLHIFFLLHFLASFISRMITIPCLLHSFEFLFLASRTNLSKMGCYVYGHGSPREFPWRDSCSPVACPVREYL